MKSLDHLRAFFETQQVKIYFGAVVLAAIVALLVPGTTALESAVNPALALMLFVTFLQVPLADLGRAFARVRFLAALLVTNFVVVPIFVAGLIQFCRPNRCCGLASCSCCLRPASTTL